MSTLPAGDLLNRELGILEFNARVLAQAADPGVPLMERLKFICIVSSNLDEFFEIRIAGLKEQMRDNPSSLTPDGLSVQQAFGVVTDQVRQLVTQQYAMLQDEILPLLEKERAVGVVDGEVDGPFKPEIAGSELDEHGGSWRGLRAAAWPRGVCRAHRPGAIPLAQGTRSQAAWNERAPAFNGTSGPNFDE